MKIERLFKLEQLHKLIKSGYNGKTNDYARRLKISRSCFFLYKEELENMGAVIDYSRISNQYKYLNDFEFEIKIKFSTITEKEMKKIKGGMNSFIQSIFLDRRNLSLSMINNL